MKKTNLEKDIRIFEKQAYVIPSTSMNKEKENYWGTHKWKKHVWVFDQGLEIEKDFSILILIESSIWPNKEILGKADLVFD